MAKKGFNINDRTQGKDLSMIADEIDNIADTSKQAIFELVTTPSQSAVMKVKETVEKDELLRESDKQLILKRLQEDYLSVFSFDNCPENYEDLKNEVKFLSKLSKHSFLIMAQRLLKIRDEELYKQDGYSNFKDFIEKELDIKRSSVYEYMDVVKFFGLNLLLDDGDVGVPRHETNYFEYSKLKPFIPLFKQQRADIPEEQLKKEIIDAVKIGKNTYELRNYAKDLKERYGISVKSFTKKESKFTILAKQLLNKIPNKLTDEEQELALKLVNRLRIDL